MSTREKIIESSIQLFSEDGYEGTSLTNIAKGAGIKKPSLYAHFSSKEEIFFNAIKKINFEYEKMAIEALNHLQHDTTEQKLYHLMHRFFKELIQQGSIAEFYYRFLLFPPKEMEEKIKELYAQSDQIYFQLVQEAIDAGKQKKEIDESLPTNSIVKSYVCMMSGLQIDVRYYSFDEKEAERHLSQIWKVFWSGVRAKG
ncbi:TetR/AcrR family transcriptional regulator [Halalkalibacter krulwichiae]|uniref:Biofilm operon icaADBC HTH-type negative transcriptional regulator IcaR n=1 Tax=Halalkalibacter krulwichiae TaxID=199441 RepID=A0A1X9MMU4_9BACI|nr:TetR/AcrR family transcriptional regulator [Halalkalibacter krulwichiae]ARK32582.1 Biofilm operon icaADBC HTH-type negative transcriptional regulator IcaR [Halalkalibacter krulwichiae]